MKLKKIAAVISAAAVMLALAGCGEGSQTSSTPNSEQSSTGLNPEESTSPNQTSESSVVDVSAFEYEHDDDRNGMKITGYKLQESEVHIPETIDGEKVIGIGENAFKDCTSITSISIPDSVTEIGDTAFGGCTSLTSITIPDSVTEISGSAFVSCTSLTSVTIPNSVTSIGVFAFSDCTSLTSITIPDSVTSIESGAFGNCKNIKATYKGQTYDHDHISDLNKAINSN